MEARTFPPDRPAEAAVVRRFRDRVRVFAARRLGDPGAAEDVAQEVLRRVLVALREERLRDPEALPAFVLQTARHVCLDRFRAADRKRSAMDALRRERPLPAFRDPISALVDGERRARVREALERLDEGDRDLLRDIYYWGKETGTLASELGITAGALRVRKHRALRRLEELVAEAKAGNARESGTTQ